MPDASHHSINAGYYHLIHSISILVVLILLVLVIVLTLASPIGYNIQHVLNTNIFVNETLKNTELEQHILFS